MNFDPHELYSQVLAALDERLQGVACGIVGMGDTHRLVFGNDAKVALSGVPAERVLGRHAFAEVAPRATEFRVAPRLEGESTLHGTIGNVLRRRMRPTAVTPSHRQRDRAMRQFLLVQHV